MKTLFKVVGGLVLLVALAGAIYLVQKNQETRRGAAGSDVRATVLPSKVNTVVGQNFTVHVWIDTGGDLSKLAGAELGVFYDANMAEFVSAEAQSGYTILNENLDGVSSGIKVFKMVTLGAEKGGAVDLLKVTFRAKTGENGTIGIGGIEGGSKGAQVMISGQSEMWEVSYYSSGSYGLTGGVTSGPVVTSTACVPKPACVDGYNNSGVFTGAYCDLALAAGATFCPDVPCSSDSQCPSGQFCWHGSKSDSSRVNMGACRPNVTPTAAVLAKEGQACGGGTQYAVSCAPGLVCTYKTTTTTNGKVVGVSVGGTGICTKASGGPTLKPGCKMVPVQCIKAPCPEQMVCPTPTTTKPVLSCDYLRGLKIGTQTYANQCLTSGFTKACFNKYTGQYMGCNKEGVQNTCTENSIYAESNILCDVKFVAITPTPSVSTNVSVTLMGKFEKATVVKGDEVKAILSVNSGMNRVSAGNIKVKFDREYFEILSVTPVEGATVLKNNFDKTTGVVELFLTRNEVVAGLPANPEFATVVLKTKVAGVTTFNYDSTFKNEVAGVDQSGKSVGFNVLLLGTGPRLFITEPVVETKCTICATGLAKAKGNADCNDKVDLLDFEYWRNEAFDKKGMTTTSNQWKSDFTCDGKADLLDFETWRMTMFP